MWPDWTQFSGLPGEAPALRSEWLLCAQLPRALHGDPRRTTLLYSHLFNRFCLNGL